MFLDKIAFSYRICIICNRINLTIIRCMMGFDFSVFLIGKNNTVFNIHPYVKHSARVEIDIFPFTAYFNFMLKISDNSSIIFCIIIVCITHPSEVTLKRRVVFINSRLLSLYRVYVCIISLTKALSSLGLFPRETLATGSSILTKMPKSPTLISLPSWHNTSISRHIAHLRIVTVFSTS